MCELKRTAAGAGPVPWKSIRESRRKILGAQALVGRAESGFSKAARRAVLSPESIRLSGRIKRCPFHEGLNFQDLRRLLSEFPGGRFWSGHPCTGKPIPVRRAGVLACSGPVSREIRPLTHCAGRLTAAARRDAEPDFPDARERTAGAHTPLSLPGTAGTAHKNLSSHP